MSNFRTPEDLARAKAGADEARALLEAGVITPAEHRQLLNLMWQLHKADGAASWTRERKAEQAMKTLHTLGERLAKPGEQ